MTAPGDRFAALWRLRQTRMVGHLAWSAVGQVAVAAIGLVGVRVLTELAPPDVFGTANLLITLLMLIGNVCVAPVTNTQARYHSRYAAEGAAAAFTRTMIDFALRGALGAGLAMLLGYAIWTQVQQQDFDFGLAAILVAWIPVQALRNALLTRILAERRQARQSMWLTVEAVVTLALTAGALLLAATPAMFLAGNLAAIVLVGLTFVAISPADRDIRRGTAAHDHQAEAYVMIREYGLPFVVIAILSWLGNLSDRYVLGGALGVEAVGIYAASFGIASRAMLMVGAMSVNAFRPALFEAKSTGQTAHAASMFRVWLMFTITVAFLLVMLFLWIAPLVAELLLAAEYRGPAAMIMVWVAIGYGIQTVNQVVESGIMSAGNSSRLIWPMVAGAVANLALALVLIPIVGLTGAAMANAASFLIQLAATCVAFVMLQRSMRETPVEAQQGRSEC